jgi:hypothetical protein
MLIPTIETEFEDGHWIVTTTAKSGQQLSSPSEINVVYKPSVAPDELVAEHQKRVRAAEQRGLIPRRVQTASDVEAAQHRQQQLKARHRRSVGLISSQELNELAGPHMRGSAKALDAEIRKNGTPSSS